MSNGWKSVLVMASLVLTGTASASWYCDVECKQSGNIELDRIEKHASGPAYGDFQATCKEVHRGQFLFAKSGCSHSYCVRYEQSTRVLSGSGATLTEARQKARAGCRDEGDFGWCGVGFYRSVGQYSCRQY